MQAHRNGSDNGNAPDVPDAIRRAKTCAPAAPVESRLSLDVQAPAAARAAVGDALSDRVPAELLDRAKLVISEIVTNSVQHGGASPDGDVILRIRRSEGSVRLEVED